MRSRVWRRRLIAGLLWIRAFEGSRSRGGRVQFRPRYGISIVFLGLGAGVWSWQDRRTSCNAALPTVAEARHSAVWRRFRRVLPNVDLFLDKDIDDTVSPLDWLKGGQDVEQVVFLANRLESS